MTDLTSKDQFAEAFEELDATCEPAEIRRLLDRDQNRELLQSKSGKWYALDKGELREVAHGDEEAPQEKA